MVQRIDQEPENEPGPIDLDERLGEAIEAYLERVEGGHPPDPEAFAAGYPELGDDLVAALEGLALVNGLVGGSGSGGPGHRLEEGRRVAGYRIVRELGRGGMGIVYEALHVGLDRPVALKVLGGQAAPDSSGRRRFLNEAKTAAGLHHTHIVPVFDVGQVGGLCYYAMQRIEGSGLDRVLRHLRRDRTVAAGASQGSASNRGGRATSVTLVLPDPPGSVAGLVGDATRSWAGSRAGAPWLRGEAVDEPPPFVPPRGSAYYRWVAEVGRQAAEALGHAHKCGVIHRDIKPSNILIDGRGMIWVADFGLARRLADPSQTQSDSLLGTPRYMSPEQARTGAIDGRADVYSLGATLYELITLRPPFDGQSAAELIVQIADQEPPRPRRFDPRVPLDLETILLKALGKRPADRYATADELAEDLARFLAHEPVRARRIGPAGRIWRFARRHPSVTAVSTTATTIVLATATLAYVSVVRERDEAILARAAAKTAQARTEDALRDAQAARLAEIKEAADAIHLSDSANRRTRGLGLLSRAPALGPDPAMLVRLRDQAVRFLSARDVEARPPIAVAGPRGLAFGPNGQRIAALRDDNELGIWGVDAGDLIETASLPTPPGRNRGPGGPAQAKGGWRGWSTPRIATAGPQAAVVRPDGGGLRLFDLSNPTTPADDLPLKGHDVISLVATPDGHTIATLDRPAREARGPGPVRPEFEEIRVSLWDRDHPEAPRVTRVVPPPKVDPSRPDGPPRGWPRLPLLAIAPDGSTVAVARPGETEVTLWDGDGEPLEPPTIDARVNISALAIGPAGLLAVAGGAEIVVWDLAGPKPLPGLGRRQGYVTQLRFNPRDGSLLAAAVAPSGVEIWDLAAHDLVAALPTRDPVEDLAFAPDGRTLAATQSASIALWSIVEPVAQFQLPETGERPIAMAFGPGDRLAIASLDNGAAGALRLWGGPGRCPPEVQTWDGVKPGAVAFDDRGRLATLDPRGLRWFAPPDPKPVAAIDLPDPPRGRGPSPSTSNPPPPVVTASPVSNPSLPPGRIATRSLARSRDGQALAFLRTRDEGRPSPTSHRAGDVLIWRAGEPAALARLDLPGNHEAPPPGPGRLGNLVALSHDGSRLYHCGPAGDRLSAFDLRATDAPPRLEWTAQVRDATCLAISPDGRTLAIGERTGDLALIRAADGAVRRPATPADDAGNRVESIAFSPDGLTLALGGRDTIRLWAVVDEPRPLVRLAGHRGNLNALAYDANGSRLAAADEKTVKVWDLRRLRDELATLRLGW